MTQKTREPLEIIDSEKSKQSIIQTITLGNDFEPLKISLKDKLAATKQKFGGIK